MTTKKAVLTEGHKSGAVRRCSRGCKHPYQDSLYGPGMRVMTYHGKGKAYDCTVCGQLHPV